MSRKGQWQPAKPRKDGTFRYPGITNPLHAPDDLCGGRRLAGEEFAARAAELEAIEKARQEKQI